MALSLYFLTPLLLMAMIAATVTVFEGYRLSDPRMVRTALAIAVGLLGVVGTIVVASDAAYLDWVAAWLASRPHCPTLKPGEYALCAGP